jgi:hypothetical protein
MPRRGAVRPAGRLTSAFLPPAVVRAAPGRLARWSSIPVVSRWAGQTLATTPKATVTTNGVTGLEPGAPRFQTCDFASDLLDLQGLSSF